MRILPHILGLALALSTLSLASVALAEAPTVKLNPTQITRETKFRPDSHHPSWISYDDCARDDVLHLPVTLSGHIGNSVEVWAGPESVDCTASDARSGNSPLCWRLFSFATPKSATNLDLLARDIVGQHTPNESESGPGSGKEADCSAPKQANDAPVNVTLTAMIVDKFGEVMASDKWSTAFDVRGPSAPQQLAQKAAGTTIDVSWSASESDKPVGYTIFCTPVLGSMQEEDAGKSSECSSDLNQAKLDTFACGSSSGTSYVFKELLPGTTYTMAVASLDDLGNIGPISKISCATTDEIDAGTSPDSAPDANTPDANTSDADSAVDSNQAKDTGSDGPIGNTNSQDALISCTFSHSPSRGSSALALIFTLVAVALSRRCSQRQY